MTRTFEEALDTQVGIALEHHVPAMPDLETVENCIDTADYWIDRDGYIHIIDNALAALEIRSLDEAKFIMREIAALVARKQHDYGHRNILRHGKTGLRVRMADKVERLRNLSSKGRQAENESADDSFRDLIGYSLIGMMLDADTFTLPLERDVR